MKRNRKLALAMILSGAPVALATPAVAQTHTVTVDYNDTRRIGTPNIFGIVPKTAWEERESTFPLLRRYGIKFARTTALLPIILPNTTVAQYEASMNSASGQPGGGGPADPTTWNWGDGPGGGGNETDNMSWQVPYLKAQGITVYLTIHNIPKWLAPAGANCNGPTCRQVPTNWNVYRDIVRKVYEKYRDSVSYVNILNEPEFGTQLQISGTPYAGVTGDSDKDRVNAARDMLYHASQAIRSVSSTVKIGGYDLISDYFGEDSPKNFMYMKETNDSAYIAPSSAFGEIPASDFNFYSNHPYANRYRGTREAANTVANVTTSIGRGPGSANPLEIFHSEYNYTTLVTSNSNPGLVGVHNMAFLGTALSDMMYQPVSGASFYLFINPKLNSADESAGEEGFWAYDFDANGNIFANQNMKAFRLASRVLGLGDGAYSVKGVSPTEISYNSAYYAVAAGAINVGGERVMYMGNRSPTDRTIVPVVRNPGFAGPAVIEVYQASTGNEGIIPVSSTAVTINTTDTTLPNISMPAFSVIGVKVKPVVSSANFESGTVGTAPAGWSVGTSTCCASVIADTDNGSNKALRLSDTSGSAKAQADQAITSTAGRITVTFRARASQTNQEAGLTILGSSGTALATIGFDGNGQFYGYDLTTKLPNLAPYTADTWYQVRVVIDTALDVYDAYIGNTQVVDRQRLRNAASNVASIRANTANSGTGTFYYDDVTVTK